MKGQRIAIIAAEAQVRGEIRQVVTAIGCNVIGEAENPEDGLRLVRRTQPDLVLLEPANRGLNLLDILGQEANIPVIAVLGPKEHAQLGRVAEGGAAGIVFKPIGALELAAALVIAQNNYGLSQDLRKKIRQLEEELELRKLIDRAKGKLMSECGMSESEAYRWLQKTSMNMQRSLRRTVTDVLKDRIELPEREAD